MAAVARDEALIRAVYAEHGKAMLAYASRLTGDRAAAEDVVQEALVRVWKHSEAITNGRGSTRGWLLTIVRNLVIDKSRARASRPNEVGDGNDVIAAVTVDPTNSMIGSIDMLAALATLSPEHRAVMWQLYFVGVSTATAAEILGVPPGTIKSRLHHALRRLRTHMGLPSADTPPGPLPATSTSSAPAGRPSLRSVPRPRPGPPAPTVQGANGDDDASGDDDAGGDDAQPDLQVGSGS